MQQTGLLCKVVSLLAMVAILAIAWGMDQFLVYQHKLASASFEYTQSLVSSAACALALIAVWFGLGWLVLFKCGYSRLIWITFLVVSLFWALVLYLWVLIPWPPVHSMAWALDLEYSRPNMKSTTIFIAVLGFLNLALRSRQRLGE
jgi:hypothetical protein